MKLVFDIETSGYKLEDLEESQQEYILRYAEREKDPEVRAEKRDEAIRYMNLYPFTSRVVAIGMTNTDTQNSQVLYLSDEPEEFQHPDKQVVYKGMTEKQILETFWDYITRVEGLITFNGKNFDAPFLTMRSALLGVKPSANIITSKYDKSFHLDLQDEFTFNGAIRKFNLDFYCKSFGIDSPKSHGVTGMEVNELFRAGKCRDIAQYCYNDVVATFRLYKIWSKYLRV